MENLALRSIPHKIYNFTFLTQVIIHIGLEGCVDKELLDKRFDEVKAFFARFFQTDVVKEEFDTHKGISLNNGNGISYEFSLSHVSVNIRRNAYKSFLETALTAAFPLKQFCYSALDLNCVNEIFIHKKSLFPFDLDEKESVPDMRQMEPVVFSKEFIDFPIDDSFTVPEALYPMELRQFVSEDIEVAVSVGMGASKKVKNSYGIVVDIVDCPATGEDFPKGGLKEGEFDNMLLKLNDKIFDAFHWVVSDNIISLMNHK